MVFLHKSVEWNTPKFHDLVSCRYDLIRSSSSESGLLHPYLGRFEDAVIEGQAAARAAENLKIKGFYPDIIISHAGFGNGLYLKDVFPKARRIGFFEWYYNSGIDSDVHFLYALHGERIPLDRAMRLRTWNAVTLLELAQSDQCVTPTKFQFSQFPQPCLSNFNIIHEGIDYDFLSNIKASFPDRPKFFPSDPSIKCVTHVARGFELYRGFPQAIQALSILQQKLPDVHVLIAGSDQVCYGGPELAPNGQSWGAWAKECSGLDPKRTHWLGMLQTNDYHQLLAHSNAHLYLTIPFVLSWSVLEVMAAGVPLVCSDTAPMRDIIPDEDHAHFVPFGEPSAIASALIECLANSKKVKAYAASSKLLAKRFSIDHGLDAWSSLVGLPRA